MIDLKKEKSINTMYIYVRLVINNKNTVMEIITYLLLNSFIIHITNIKKYSTNKRAGNLSSQIYDKVSHGSVLLKMSFSVRYLGKIMLKKLIKRFKGKILM